MSLCILHKLRRRVKAHRLAVEQRSEKGFGLVTLEPAAFMDKQRKTGGVALRKTVFAKAFDLLEDRVGETPVVVTFQHAIDDPIVVFLQAALTLPGRHRTTQLISFARCEASR